jgi:competence ComEA-like helix-hairpin-helix protein
VRLLNDFNKALGFTPQESRVVLFLVATFLAGMGIRILKSERTEGSRFDYAASDSEFEARSQLLAALDTAGADPGMRDLALHEADPALRDLALHEADPALRDLALHGADPALRDLALHGADPALRDLALHRLDSSGGGRQPGPMAKRLSPRTININSASREELTRLPGIGNAMAERILAYREENGSFSSIDELINVNGIGRKKLDRIKPYCTLGR